MLEKKPDHPPESTVSRRSALYTFGLTGLALAASSTPVKAAYLQKFPSSVDLSELPSEWSRQQGSALGEYARYISMIGLTRITVRQVIDAHAKEHQGVWNAIPAKMWWPQIVPTLRVIDRVAAQLDMPVGEIISAYRAPAYNKRCPGAKSGSWHQANVAVDVKFQISPSTVTALTRNLRDRGLFRGGVGGYSTFTHIDTRGVNVNW